jgi:lipid-binding SYLF domain-containing protein
LTEIKRHWRSEQIMHSGSTLTIRRHDMKAIGWLVSVLAAFFVALGAGGALGAMSQREKDKARAEIAKMERDTLAQLYRLQPGAKATVEKAAGYAVFSNFGVKIFIAGSGSGKGVAVSSGSKKRVYMKMLEAQAGLGFGVKKFRLVWVFDNDKALNDFIHSGWQIGGQASATAKKGAKGDAYTGAMSVGPGVWVYQMAGDGLALELTGKGTKYYKDDDLN